MATPPKAQRLTKQERKALGRSDILFEQIGCYYHGVNHFTIVVTVGLVFLVMGVIAFLGMGHAIKEYPHVFLGAGAVVAVVFIILAAHRSRQQAKLEKIMNEPDPNAPPSPRRKL